MQAAQPEPRRGDRAPGQRPRRGRTAVRDLNDVVGGRAELRRRQPGRLGMTIDKLASITTNLTESLDHIKQTLHVTPTAFANFINIYEPAHGALTGVTGGHQLHQPAQLHLRRQFRPPHGWVPNSRRSCASSTWRRSSRTGSTTSRRSDSTSSSARGRGRQRDHLQRGLDAPRLRPARHRRRRTPPVLARRRRPPNAADRAGLPRHDGAPRSRVMTRSAFVCAPDWLTALVLAAVGVCGCGWRGLNSLPLPGTKGGGPGSYQIQAQVPDVNNIQPNSRVRVGDVNGRQRHQDRASGLARAGDDAHQRRRELPANATAKDGPDQPAGLTAHRARHHRRASRHKAGCTTVH